MSETNTKIGNYTITDVDIDTFISGMPQEQQMYRKFIVTVQPCIS